MRLCENTSSENVNPAGSGAGLPRSPGRGGAVCAQPERRAENKKSDSIKKRFICTSVLLVFKRSSCEGGLAALKFICRCAPAERRPAMRGWSGKTWIWRRIRRLGLCRPGYHQYQGGQGGQRKIKLPPSAFSHRIFTILLSKCERRRCCYTMFKKQFYFVKSAGEALSAMCRMPSLLRWA